MAQRMSVLLIHDLAEFGAQRAQHVLMAPAGDERFRLDVVAFGCQRRGVAEDVVGVTDILWAVDGDRGGASNWLGSAMPTGGDVTPTGACARRGSNCRNPPGTS